MKEDDEIKFTEFDELDFGGMKEEDRVQQQKYVEKNIWQKLSESGGKITFAKDIMALFNYMRDPVVPWQKKAIVVAGLLYFIIPFDTIPDVIPIIGYLDDLGVIMALVKFLGKELTPYYAANNNNVDYLE